MERFDLDPTAAWEAPLDSDGPCQVWLEIDGRRVSGIQALHVGSAERVGPVSFSAIQASLTGMRWSGGRTGDRMTVLALGGLVDEKLASRELESEAGWFPLEIEGTGEIGVLLRRGTTTLRRTLSWDPESPRDLEVRWPATESVDVVLTSGEPDAPSNAAVFLAPLESGSLPSVLVQLEDGVGRAQDLPSGRYFFSLEGSGRDQLICGVAEFVSGQATLVLEWQGCLQEISSGTVEIHAIQNVDLSDVPVRLRRARVEERIGSEEKRPHSIRIPCSSRWSLLL